jgi:hypothetical protein
MLAPDRDLQPAVRACAERQAMLDVEVQHQDVAPGLLRLQRRRRDRERLRDDGMDLAAQSVALLHRFEHQRSTEVAVRQGSTELDLARAQGGGILRPSRCSQAQASRCERQPGDHGPDEAAGPDRTEPARPRFDSGCGSDGGNQHRVLPERSLTHSRSAGGMAVGSFPGPAGSIDGRCR